MKFADKIKLLRRANQLTQAQVADALGISRIAYSGYENYGKYPRNHEMYQKLASVFHCDKNYLLLECDSDDEMFGISEISRCEAIAKLECIISEFKILVESDKLQAGEIEFALNELNMIYNLFKEG